MKNLNHFRQFLFLIVVMISLSACREGGAEESVAEKPYKATTVDECIQEMECVWEAFKEIALDDYFRGEKNQPEKYLPHWKEDVRIGFVGDVSGEVKKNVKMDAKKVSNYFPYKIYLSDKNPNLLVAVLPNFNAENIENIKGRIMSFTNVSEQEYSFISSEANRKRGCISIPKSEKAVVNRTIILANTSGMGQETCLRKNIYAALGLSHQGLFWLRLKDFQANIENASTVTDLHLIVSKIYYHSDFHKKVNYESAYKEFRRIYPDIVREYNKMHYEGEE